MHASPRQAQILDLICEGKTDVQIARHLNLSKATVRSHLARFFKDNRINSRSQAAGLWAVARSARRV